MSFLSGMRAVIHVPRGHGDDEKDAIYVGINGIHDFVIPRDVDVEVPIEVYEVLANARKPNGNYRFGGLVFIKEVEVTTEYKLDKLAQKINDRLDEIHDEAIRGFRSLAKSTGQRTRVDRL